MHVGEVHPNEGWLTRLVLSLDEVHSSVGDIIVDRHHTRLGQRACVLAHLLADPAEPWIDCWVVYIRGFAVHHAARPILRTESWVFWIVRQLRLFFGVQMVEIAVELIEAVHRGKELVSVAKMVLAELPGRVAERLEQRGDRWVFLLQPQCGAGQAHLGHTCPKSRLAGDERCATGGATLLTVIIREHHAFL